MKNKSNLFIWIVLVVILVIIFAPKFIILAQRSQAAVTQGYYIEQSLLRFLLGFTIGMGSSGLLDGLHPFNQLRAGKQLIDLLNTLATSLVIFIPVHLIFMVISTIALRLAEWISNPLFHSQHTFWTMVLFSFIAWMVGFWLGYAIQSIPRIHKYMESINPAPEKQKESVIPSIERIERPVRHLDDLQAIRVYCHAEAVEWWKTNELESAICDKCNGPVRRNSGYLIGRSLYCGLCEDMFSEEYRNYLIRDPNFYGQGVLEKARKRLLES